MVQPSLAHQWDTLHERFVEAVIQHPLHELSDGEPCTMCAHVQSIGKRLDLVTNDLKRQIRMANNISKSDDEQLSGELVEVRYSNDGWIIGIIDTGCGQATVKGNLSAPSLGSIYTFFGRMTTDSRGQAFAFDRYVTAWPRQMKGIVRYLTSNVAGMTDRRAKALVDTFGETTLSVMKDSPSLVAEKVDCIAIDLAFSAASALKLIESKERVLVGLHALFTGITMPKAIAQKAFDAWGDRALELVQQDPYVLMRFRGVGFTIADQVRANLYIPMDAPSRIRRGIEYILETAAQSSGDTCISDVELEKQVAKVLTLLWSDVEKEYLAMLAEGLLTVREDSWLDLSGTQIALTSLYEAERTIASRLLELNTRTDVLPIDGLLEGLAGDQVSAMQAIAEASCFVLTGAPGTGKTFLVKRVVDMLMLEKISFALCAPTGKAANRLMELTGETATTIHVLLKCLPQDSGVWTFAHDETNPLDIGALVVDEFSMVDVRLLASLMKALPPGCRVLFVGDTNQLPPVGPGAPLRDIIESRLVPMAELREIKRQDAGNIVRNCHRIRDGMNLGDVMKANQGSDFQFALTSEATEALQCIVDLVTYRIPERFGFNPITDIQVLTPMRERGVLSCQSLNAELRKVLNPFDPVKGATFAVNDKVIQTRNDYSLNVMNGMIGQVVNVSRESRTYDVLFERKHKVTIPWADHWLELAYAITVHKSQGSEWPCVVIPVERAAGNGNSFNRNLLYTAISRAQSLCVCVGDPSELPVIIKRTLQNRRSTFLAKLLMESVQSAA